MQSTALFLLLLLPPADTAGDTAAGIQASLRSELGDVSMVIAPDTLVTPSMWQGESAQMRARFVVHVVWKDPDHATIELLAGADATSKTYRGGRDLSFAAEDGKVERGRAIGLVIAELLRSSPTAAWTEGKGREPRTGSPRSPLALGGMFAAEHASAGVWAYGPALTYGFGLSQAFELRVDALALFGSRDQYKDMGLLVGARWSFLRLAQNRHTLGIGLGVGYLYESATFSVTEYNRTTSAAASRSNLVGAANLHARVTLWRSLRLVAEGGLRVLSGGVARPTLTIARDADDGGAVTVPGFSYWHWRPVVAVGLEMAF